jgi:glycosyltransferase involved in cell wall biosynthesis
MKEKTSTRKTKIAFVIDQLGTGGTERQLKALAEGLNRDRFEPSLYLLRGETEHPMKPAEIPCTVLGIHSIASLDGLRKIWIFSRRLKKQGCQIVQTYFQDASLCGALAGKLAGVSRVVISVRDLLFWADSHSIRPLRWAIQLSHGVVVNSRAVKDMLEPLIGKKEVQIIPNGISTGTAYAKNPEAKRRLTEELGVNEQIPIIVMVSNCNREVKRVDLFIESAQMVMKQKDAIFLIVGDGHLRPSLERYARDLGVASRVVFAGRRNDVDSVLAGSDVFVNASDSEGLSNSVMEAMRAGLPVVASDVDGNRTLVTNGQNGYLFRAGDAHHLATQLVQLLSNPSMGLDFGEKAKHSIECNFSVQTMIERYESFYEAMISQSALYGGEFDISNNASFPRE